MQISRVLADFTRQGQPTPTPHDDRPHNHAQTMNVKRKATSSLSAAVTSPSAPKKLKQGSLTAFFGSPAGSKDLHTAPKLRFDKDAWITSLTSTQKELLKYRSWMAIINSQTGDRDDA